MEGESVSEPSVGTFLAQPMVFVWGGATIVQIYNRQTAGGHFTSALRWMIKSSSERKRHNHNDRSDSRTGPTDTLTRIETKHSLTCFSLTHSHTCSKVSPPHGLAVCFFLSRRFVRLLSPFPFLWLWLGLFPHTWNLYPPWWLIFSSFCEIIVVKGGKESKERK